MAAPIKLEVRCGECLIFGAIQGMDDGLVLVDRQGRIFHVNRSAEDILGVAGPRVMGNRLRSLLRHQGLARFWVSALKEDEPVSTDLGLPTGVILRATVSPCRSATGEPLGKALLLRDVSREKKIQVELPASVARRLVETAGPEDTGSVADGDSKPHLTRREREILRHLAAGLSNSAMAAKLRVRPNSVASHLKHLYPKIGVSSRAQAAAYALSRGIQP